MNLWVCERCEMIGSAEEAAKHRELTSWDESPEGHEVRELDPTTSAAVRIEQERLRLERIGAFISFARMNAGNRGAWR